jgi:CHAT domain-containing protein
MLTLRKFNAAQSGLVILTSIIIANAVALPASTQELPEITLMEEGKYAYEQGDFILALEKWESAEKSYRQANNKLGSSGSLVNQSQALTAIGMHRRACKASVAALQLPIGQASQICEAESSSISISGSLVTAEPLHTIATKQLGDSLRMVGNLERSQQILLQARQQVSSANPTLQSSILTSLGNTARDLGNRERDRKNEITPPDSPIAITGESCGSIDLNSTSSALNHYQSAIDCYQKAAQQTSTANPKDTKALQAKLNQLSLILEVAQWLTKEGQTPEAKKWLASSNSGTLIQELKTDLPTLAFNHETGTLQISFARHFTHWAKLTQHPESFPVSEQLLKTSLSKAQGKAPSLVPLALGNLGWLYEQQENWQQAIDYTNQALQRSSQTSNDLQYQWKWQQARILRQQAQPERSIVAYEDAIKILESARQDVLTVNPDAQFAFRDSVEPVYRELIDLKLKQPNRDDKLYESVIKQFDALQLAELENFLGCKIRPESSTTADKISKVDSSTTVGKISKDESAAIFYPIILDDRIEVIVSLPNGQFDSHQVKIQRTELAKTLKSTYEKLVSEQQGEDYRLPVELLYDQIIRPFKSKLKDSQAQTLVFVSDGDLRKIPMSTLLDKETGAFLIDQYPIAITPGVNLLGSKTYPRNQLKALIGGLTSPLTAPVVAQGSQFSFENLAAVQPEIDLIVKNLPKSKVLKGSNFTAQQIQKEIQGNPYPIVHFATHGNFSSDPRGTFFVTDKGAIMTINDLQSILQQQDGTGGLDLIVFSACQTASGDRRATLGMAGAAIRSGASSTLASLWAVNDTSTAELMGDFYESLTQDSQISKAKALQIATQKVRRNHPHPSFWSPFIIVGNWR